MYWPPRLLALGRSLRKRGDELFVIEIAGNGSPYDFVGQNHTNRELAWSVLFPNGDLRQMSGRKMARAVEGKLDEFPSGAAAVRWARRNHVGIVIFDNARLEDVPRCRVTEFVKQRIYANIDAVLIPAESHTSSYIHWGIKRNYMFFGVNVVDNKWFSSRADVLRLEKTKFLRDKKLPSKFFLGVGRHIEKKNWVMCLEAYRQYRQRSSESMWGLVLIGDGSEHACLEETIVNRSIHDVYLPGTISGDDLVNFYAAAGALVLPSLYGETWGLVVNEAMACGLPILVSRQCGCAETLVQNGMNGLVFSPENPEELAACMLQMSSLSDEERSKMGLSSKEIVRSWGLERFVEGAEAAISACSNMDRGFVSVLDRLLIGYWNGRFRPT
jgi:glycosyltransferase involved in cell wall biosynthesis